MALAKNVLVTGGCGFVGSHLVDALLANGHNVRVLDNLDPQVHGDKVPDYLHPDAELIRGDIQDSAAVAKALRGIDVVFHLAAVVGVGQSMYEISRYVETNTYGTAVLLQAILNQQCKVQKLVIASSMSIYGEGKYFCDKCGIVPPPLRPAQQLQEKQNIFANRWGFVPPPLRPAQQLQEKQWEMVCSQCGRELKPIPTDEIKPLQCSSIYALSKKDQEEMSLLFGRTYNLPVVALRYFNIYGPRQALSNPYTGVAAIFASRLLNRRPPLIFEDGMQMRDFVSVHDIVRANLLAMQSDAAEGQVFNIGSGQPVNICQVAEALAGALANQSEPPITGQAPGGEIR